MVYYNEIDPKAAAWLRELIRMGLIAPGEVDERSIEDVVPNELRGYTQCHFFAGVGVWSYALRRAGWPDSKPVWTGSCPCQPFSAAGKGEGFADERHLWPAFFHLIEQCRPPEVFGEQVASKAVDPWIDLVQADLEGVGYAFGCVPFPSAGVGAPHIRDRTFWVGSRVLDDAKGSRRRVLHTEDQRQTDAQIDASPDAGDRSADGCGPGSLRLGHPGLTGLQGHGGDGDHSGEPGQLREGRGQTATGEKFGGGIFAEAGSSSSRQPPAGPVNGFWGAADWLFCRDGKWRPTQSLDVEMADGLADRLGYSRICGRYSLSPLIQKGENRVMRLKGYGNAINAEAATAFIEAYMTKG